MKDGPIHTEAPAAMDQRLWAYYSHCLTSDVRIPEQVWPGAINIVQTHAIM